MYTPLITDNFITNGSALRIAEKTRIKVENHLNSLTTFPRNKDWGMHLPEIHPAVLGLSSALATIEKTEDELIEELVTEFKGCPLFAWSQQFKGMGPGKLLARFVAEIGDPYLKPLRDEHDDIIGWEPRTFAQLKSYSGMSVVNGKQPKHIKGQQSSYRDNARIRLWNITEQLIKQHAEQFWGVYTDGLMQYGMKYTGVENERRHKYEIFDDRARGVVVLKTKTRPQTDEQYEVHSNKRAKVLVGVAFLEALYNEAKSLHE
jgi:hypothetical protein